MDKPPWEAFKLSCENFGAYPHNLVSSIPKALANDYEQRLNSAAPNLFVATSGGNEIKVFELGEVDRGLDAAIESLDYHEQSSDTPNEVPPKIRHRKCRFIFIHPQNRHAPLGITFDMMKRILTYHQVMPDFIDFILAFGPEARSASIPRSLSSGGFRDLVTLGKHNRLSLTSSRRLDHRLWRSGRCYQLCYYLRRTGTDSSTGTECGDVRWSNRNAAIYHQFDIVSCRTFWMIVSSDAELKLRVGHATGADGSLEDSAHVGAAQDFDSSLAIHWQLAQWSIEQWAWYSQSLADMYEEQTRISAFGNHASATRHEETLQATRQIEGLNKEALVALDSNLHVLRSLHKFYANLTENEDFVLRTHSQRELRGKTQRFLAQLTEVMKQSEVEIIKIQRLEKNMEDRKNQVHENMQKDNERLIRTMHELSVLTYQLGVESRRDTAAMKIITVVTLIYLPATFVSTFFSTDIVKYQGTEHGSFSNLAFYRWIEVTLPLTVITLGLAFAWFNVEARMEARREKKEKEGEVRQ